MADNKDKKVLNVPALRFPEFTEEWKRIRVSDLLDFYSTNSLSWEQLEYESNEPYNLHYGLIHVGLPTLVDLTKDKLPSIKEENVPKKYELCKEGDVAFADASEDTNEVAKVVEFYNLDGKKVVCGLHTIHGRDNNKQTAKGFLGYCFSSTVFHNQIRRIAQGTKIYSINTRNFSEVFVGLPSKSEQHKIATLLRLIDEHISTQNKIIEKLETLIKGIRDYVLNNKLQNITKKKLGELCTITTGKLDANAMKSEGLYPFFTCAEEVYRIDSFAFDTEALLVSGNGANLGYIHYYKGKFNAYQRTYVLSNFIEDIHYIQIYLEAYLHKRIALEKSTSNTPYIVLATLAEMPIIIPNIKIQKDISNKILILKSKLITEIHIRNCYKDMRQFLLSQMFI